MIGCDKLNIHIKRVQASFAHAEILGFNLTSLAYADMASEHWDRKVEVNHIVDMINIVMFTIENYSISRDDRTWFSWFGSRDHLDD